MQAIWDDLDDSDVEGSNDYLNNFAAFTTTVSIYSPCHNISESLGSKDEGRVKRERGQSRCIRQIVWSIIDSDEAKYEAHKKKK